MIELDEVTVEADGVVLLAPVSVSVGTGESLVLQGRNGTGKTTLLRVLAGALAPSRGRVLLGGAPIDERRRDFRRRVAAMIGLPPFARDLTLRDHVDLVASTWWKPDIAQEASARVLDELHLEHLHLRYPHELSSGQSQLFGLALVLARPFEVLVVDEPEQRLDDDHVELVASALRARREAGAPLVVATHNGALQEALAGRSLHLQSTR